MAASGAPRGAAKSVSAPSPGQETTDSKMSPQSGQPPRKKLKLNVRKTSIDPDTIAVSRPKRKSAGRARYSEKIVVSEDEIEENESLADSSDLSSLDSNSLSVEADSPAPEPVPAANRQKSYGDFASYYIMDGDDGTEEEPKEETKSKPAPKTTKIKVKARRSFEKPPPKALSVKSEPELTQAPLPTPHQSIEPRPQPNPQLVQRPLPPPQLAPQQQQQQQRQPQMNVPPPIPMVSQRQTLPVIPPPEPPVMEEIKVLRHAGLVEMVQNLQDLSKALTSFGGAPTAKKSPSPQEPTTSDHDILLAMFNDDSDSNEDDGDDESKVDNDRVRKPGEQDAPLTYGIQFIMNALKSWAQQRLFGEHIQEIQRSQQAGVTQNGQPQQPKLPADLYDLSTTAEGKAILAFRRVVESGCLQVNAVLPKQLSNALRCLYVQIDMLINSGNKLQRDEKVMSYTPQIIAFQAKVDKILSQQNQARQIAAEQHMIVNQQMMHRMGMQSVPHGHMQQQPYIPQHMPHDSQRRRSSSHAHRQHSQRPILQGTPVGFEQSPAHTNGLYPPQPYPGTPVNNMPPQYPPSRDSPHSLPPNGGKNHLGKMQMYVARPNLGLKFSFAPSNPAAVQVFGPDAFPSPLEQGSNLPNRGPMANSTPQPTPGSTVAPHYNSAAGGPRPNSTPIENGMSTSQRSSKASSDGRPQPPSAFPPLNGQPALKRGSMTGVDGRSKPPSVIQPPNGKPAAKRDSITSNDSQPQQRVALQKPNGFTPVNRPKSNGSTTSSAIVLDTDSGVPSKKKRKSRSDSTAVLKDLKSAKQNGTANNTSGFPHPGAVVIDE